MTRVQYYFQGSISRIRSQERSKTVCGPTSEARIVPQDIASDIGAQLERKAAQCLGRGAKPSSDRMRRRDRRNTSDP